MNKISRRKMLAGGGLIATAVASGVGAINLAGEENKAVPAPRQKMKIVVAGGHPGDPEYGCGGTIARFTQAGHAVTMVYLNRGDPTETPGDRRVFPRVVEAKKAGEILGASTVFAGQIDAHAIVDAAHYESFRQLLAGEKPDAVFTHWPIDNHADHRAMSMLVYDAWQHMGKKFALFYYEVSTGEDTVQFAPTEYVDIAETEPRKRAACFAHASQSPEQYYKLQEMVARMRGAESGHGQAEGFVRHVQSSQFLLP